MKKWKTIIKTIIIITIAICLLYFYAKTFIYRTTYIEYIEENVKGEGIDPYLVLSIIRVESGFNPNAISSKEAKGLMQLRDSTYSDVGNLFPPSDKEIDLYDPEINIKIGIAYFKKLIKKYNGNYYIALLAYNGGMGNVDNWIRQGIVPKDLDKSFVSDIPFKETRNYLNKVISTYNIYKLLYKI
ncbi:MAG: lytic transglycosylase domain-containing protein [Candidatus Cloacimonetes bacterium]|nr:lytic transglycosylase domain-containing protein [Candidatus Cloacimonadota bacterium]